MERQVSGVTFRVRATLAQGERLVVVSNALGWNPLLHGVALQTTPEAHPMHFTPRPVYINVEGEVGYKYVVLAEGRQPRCESFDGMRPLRPLGREMMVDDVLDAPPEGGTVPWPVSEGRAGASSSADSKRAGRESSAQPGASPAVASHHRSGAGVGGTGGPSSPGEGAEGGRSSERQQGAASGGRVTQKVGLTDQDGVLIVQYCLPVKLYKRGGAVGAEGSATPTAGSSGGGTPTPAVHSAASFGSLGGSGGGGGSLPRDSRSDLSASGAEGVLRDPYGGWSAEWDEEALLAPKGGMVRALRSVRVKWIGVCPCDVPHGDEEAVTRLLETMNCIPVFLPHATHVAFYDGYCRDTLWPVFHNVIDVYGELPTRWWVRERQSDRWKAYMDANGKFAVTVVENFHEGDLVWIQDFHLLLVPNLLARRHIAPTALFLHIPFPSSEIFRSLSVRDDILRGMLSADHIGFHLFEYARHFLTSCRRILGLTHTVRRGGCLAVEYQGREVLITVSHVGVEPTHLLSSFRASPSTVVNAAGWRTRFPGCKIVAGIDSVERLKGVPLKLRAWDAYLQLHPAAVGSAVLVQICVEDSVRPGDKQEGSANEINALADRINAAYSRNGTPAVHLEIRQQAVPLQERLALFAAADVLINTGIRDGLSLYPFEYTYVRGAAECLVEARDAAAAKVGSGRADAELAAAAVAACDGVLGTLNPGVVIVSEFTGGSRVLFGAIKVNPWKIDQVQSAIDHALNVSAEEAAARAEANLQYVRGNTTAAWAERVLVDLKSAGKAGGVGRTYMGYGLGLGYRLMGFGASFRPLNVEHVLTAYRRGGHRLFVFDYGGTLNVRDSGETRQKAFESGLLHGKDAAPPLTAETKKALRVLSEDPRNTVFIVSGKEKDVLAQAFAALPHVGLAAEHGFYFRWGAPPTSKATRAGRGDASGGEASSTPGFTTESSRASSPASHHGAGSAPPSQPGALSLPGSALGDNGQPWETCVPFLPMDEWKGLALTIMEMYAARTNGTFIVRKGSAVSWLYSDADPEFGSMQAKELQDHLMGVMSGYPVDVLSGHGYVEVRPKGVNKGAVLSIVMNRLEGRTGEEGGGVNTPRPGAPPSSSSGGPASKASASVEEAATPLRTPSLGPRGTPLHAPSSTTTVGGGYVLQGSAGAHSPRAIRPRPLEFILCIGDDQADEEMFTTIQRIRAGRLAEHRAALGKLAGGASVGGPESQPGTPAAEHSGTGGGAGPLVTHKLGSTGPTSGGEAAAPPAPLVLHSTSDSGRPPPVASPPDAPSAALTPLTYYEYTVTVGKKPSAAQYFLDDTQQMEDVLRSIARVSVKEAAAKARASSSAAVPGAPSGLGGWSAGTGAGGAGPGGLKGLAVQQAFAARAGGSGGAISLVRPGPGGGFLSLPASLHSHGGGHGDAHPSAVTAAPFQPGATPAFFSSNALAALGAAALASQHAEGGVVGGSGGGPFPPSATPYSFSLPMGTMADLSAQWSNFAGSTMNFAGLNTNIPLLGGGGGGGGVGGRLPSPSGVGGGVASTPSASGLSGRPLGQLPNLLPGAFSAANLAGTGSGTSSPSGSGSTLLGGFARAVTVSTGNPSAMAGLLAYSASTARLASLGVPGPAMPRVLEGDDGRGGGDDAGVGEGMSDDEGASQAGSVSGEEEGLGAGWKTRPALPAFAAPAGYTAAPGGDALSRGAFVSGPPFARTGSSGGLAGGGASPSTSSSPQIPGGLGQYPGSITQSNEEESVEF